MTIMNNYDYQVMPLEVYADTIEDTGEDTQELRAWSDMCFQPPGYYYNTTFDFTIYNYETWSLGAIGAGHAYESSAYGRYRAEGLGYFYYNNGVGVNYLSNTCVTR